MLAWFCAKVNMYTFTHWLQPFRPTFNQCLSNLFLKDTPTLLNCSQPNFLWHCCAYYNDILDVSAFNVTQVILYNMYEIYIKMWNIFSFQFWHMKNLQTFIGTWILRLFGMSLLLFGKFSLWVSISHFSAQFQRITQLAATQQQHLLTH